MRRIVLKPGREGPVRAGHPWVFSGAIADGLDGCGAGDVVRLASANGRFVAMGYANPRTTIAVRVLSLDEEEIDDAFVGRRLDEALALRRATLPPALASYRIINGEGDRLPGVVVDRYEDFVVCQFLTAGADRLASAIVRGIEERLQPRGIFERSEGGVRTEDGLQGVRGVRAGQEPPPRITIREGDCAYIVDLLHGQKTGFFLDQRESRARVRTLADGRRVLNAFSYSGAFAIAAGRGGAREVVSVDTSKPALALAEEAWAANDLDPTRASFVVADVFDFLRGAHDAFDLIVLDPPPFVRRRRDLEPGLRGYRDVNLQAFRRLAPGGWLMTSSCSQHLSRGQFRDVVAAAAADAGRPVTVVGESGHPPDHPTALAHVEGEYLKVLWLRA